MNLDNDYDNDGNNIVPCPICLYVYCPRKNNGKCPMEDEFARDMNLQQTLGEQWQDKFLNAGTEKGLGDLSAMIGVVSEILTAQVTNTGEELMRRVDADKHAKYLGWIEKDTMKQHITSVTGVENK